MPGSIRPRFARFDDEDVDRLLNDKGIVRHGGKIRSTINNAGRALELIDEFGSLSRFFWSYEPGAEDGRTASITPP